MQALATSSENVNYAWWFWLFFFFQLRKADDYNQSRNHFCQIKIIPITDQNLGQITNNTIIRNMLSFNKKNITTRDKLSTEQAGLLNYNYKTELQHDISGMKSTTQQSSNHKIKL